MHVQESDTHDRGGGGGGGGPMELHIANPKNIWHQNFLPEKVQEFSHLLISTNISL